MSAPHVSIIIPAYRAGGTLQAVLRALEPHVLGRDCEVVVVDSAGGDDGARAEHEWPWVLARSVAERMLPGRARNLGASIARGELLAFLDADTIPEPGWLDELEKALTPDVDLVAGAILNGTPDDRWGTVGYLLEFLEWVPERSRALEHAAGCNLLMRRTTFDQAGGFPEDLFPGEDTVFSVPFAASGKLRFAPRAQVTHLNRIGIRAVLAHQRRLGASWVQVCARVPLPGSWLAVPYLAPVAVAGRLWSVIRQLRRSPETARRAHHGPLIVAGILAWGSGVVRSPSR